MTINIENPTTVRATFQITRDSFDIPSMFQFSTYSGVIQPHSKYQLNVQFIPKINGLYDSESYTLKMPCNLITTIYVKGYGVGPYVSLCDIEKNLLSPQAYVFQDCAVNSTVNAEIYLYNNSSVNAYYHFQCEKTGVFSVPYSCGVLPPKINTPLMIKFHPSYPGNYYRRVYIFIDNQIPIYIDLIGTGFNEESRPQPLTYKHVENYRLRREAGFLYEGPAEITNIYNENGEKELYKPNQELIAWRKKICNTGTLFNEQIETVNNVFILSDNANPNNKKEITINESDIDFGQCIRSRGLIKKELIVKNHTNGKILFWWVIPKYDKTDKYQTENEFQISPNVSEIASGDSVVFKVFFRPGRDNYYYCRELEGYGTFKINRNFRLVDDATLNPSWAITVRASGHTFLPHIEHYLPKTDITSGVREIDFSPCYIGETVYQTTKIHNEGETPILFDVNLVNNADIFDVFPQHGIISPGEFQIFLFSFTPKHETTYSTILHVLLNREENYAISYSIKGVGAKISVEFSDDKEVYFKPTYIGLESEKKMLVHNSTRIPALISLSIPQRLKNIIGLDKQEIIIHGNDTIELPWKFIPQEQKKYSGVIDCQISDINNEENSHSKQSIIILGEGCEGALQFIPTECDLGSVILGGVIHKKISFGNLSDCGLNYIFKITPIDEYTPTEDEKKIIESFERKNPEEIKITPSKGFIQARSTITIEISFMPLIQREYRYKLEWAIDLGNGKTNTPSDPEMNGYTCKITGNCTIPLVEIQDIRSTCIATSRLWNSFEVYPFNSELGKLLTSFDLNNNKTTGLAQTTLPLKEFHFTFDPSPINSDPLAVYILFHNYGSIPVNYHLKLPNEVSVELENWDSGAEPSEKELLETYLIDKELFEISPRQGMLQPNETVRIKFEYRYTSLEFDGKHDLPIVLTIKDGKQVRIFLHGKTLDNTEPLIFTDNALFSLYPIPIGEMEPNRQVFYLYNSSHCNINYSIDQNIFKDFASKNYDQYIYNIENKEGIVSAHSYYPISVLFHPLEAKIYNLDIPIIWKGLESEDISDHILELKLKGEGLLPSVHRSLIDPRWYEPPSKPQLSLINDLATISSNNINLGKVPVGSVVRHILVLTNVLKDHDIQFQWELGTSLLPYDAISLNPMNGTIKPGQFTIITLTFIGMGNYSHLIQSLICNIIRDTSKDKKPIQRPKHQTVIGRETQALKNRKDILMKEKTIRAQLLTAKEINRDDDDDVYL